MEIAKLAVVFLIIILFLRLKLSVGASIFLGGIALGFLFGQHVLDIGKSALRGMIAWLGKHGATPVEIDTDGIYFVPPEGLGREGMEQFREQFSASLPDGIEVEFDGEYRSMYSYKMKNYALLTAEGEVVIKGAALKSRGLEPFQRSFLRKKTTAAPGGRRCWKAVKD